MDKLLPVSTLLRYALFFGALLLSCSDDSEVMPRRAAAVTKGYYGVRWRTDDPTDLGQRCLDAVGLRARFGVGSTPGESDFDNLYPWSDIRRCNVRRENGQTTVIYDDDPRFALDGSQGDVFVRIPKFCVEKFVLNGYEYRVVSRDGSRPHPAFIEDGHELDAVYVSAFEGYIGADSLLRSVAGVIPTSNITAQQFLDAARRRGPQYTLYDMRTVDMLFSLIAVEYGCRNTSAVMGYGIGHYRQPLEEEWDADRLFFSKYDRQQTNHFVTRYCPFTLISPGSCICICDGDQRNILTFARCTAVYSNANETTYVFDGPPMDITTNCFIGNCGQLTNWTETCSAPYRGASGRADMRSGNLDPRERNPLRYRWMENLQGNVWHFLPDVFLSDGQLYQYTSMAHYRFTGHDSDHCLPFGPVLPENLDNGNNDSDGKGVNRWVSTLVEDSLARGVAFGKSFTTAATSQQAFGAYYYVGRGRCLLVNGGGFDHRNRCNMLTTRAWDHPEVRWHLYGARLLFKDVPAQ